MGSTTPQIQEGREAFERRSWESAHDALAKVSTTGDLDPGDLWRLGLSSYLLGRVDEFAHALERAHHAYLDAGEALPAIRCAFWLGMHLANGGDMARASGWFGRAGRLLGQVEGDCAERGYVLLPVGHRQLILGDYEACARTAGDAAAVGQRFDDADLLTLAIHLKGRALVRRGDVDDGLALLDEAMLGVATDELTPMVTGLVYCSVIGACREVWALKRAQEWTLALTEWCEQQPDIVAYTGECATYRSEIHLRRGEWREAIEDARRARERFRLGSQPSAVGLAFYHEGEAHRLLGELAEAEECYRNASREGREPQPGLALLRLAQGDLATAEASIRRALAEREDTLGRARLLPAFIEIMVAAGSVDDARRACDELEGLATACARDVLDAVVAHARGSIELASGNAKAALAPLRKACQIWRAMDAPYDAARARVLLGRACRELGDEDGAALELDSAGTELDRLGASRRAAGLAPEEDMRADAEAHGLTPREREVLALVATGRTNRAIAEALYISEKTVARHVANIFAKLGLSSRAAATAYAYEHGLHAPPT